MTAAALEKLAAEASPAMREAIRTALHQPPPPAPPGLLKPSIRIPRRRKQSAPEREYGVLLTSEFPGAEVRYEALSFRLSSGARYTPDWIVLQGRETLAVVEVKGGYRLPSAARSLLAFKEAAAQFPGLPWRFAEKREGTWIVTVPAPSAKAA